MAHYAFLDENNVVTHMIPGRNEGEDGVDWEKWYSDFTGQPCKRTSFNTRGGVYYYPDSNDPHEDQSKAFRKNYARVGGTYDPVLDAFIPPKPYPSWVLNETTCLWMAPIVMPRDAYYNWDEETLSWIKFRELTE